jgi:hypothetical protein
MDGEIESEVIAPVDTATVTTSVESIDEGTAPEDDGETKKQAEPEKSFTQAEVDALVQKRLMKEERRTHRRVEQQMREQAEARTRETAPQRESFGDDDAYLEAQVEHLAEKKAAEKMEQRDRMTKQEASQDAFLEKSEKAQAKYADFQEVVSNPTLSINEGMAEFISDSDSGPDIAYFLGKNPSKAAEIASLSPIKAARELTRIEAELSIKPQPKTSSAPAPINPVGNRGGAAPTIASSDFSEYKKLRASQGARWSR